MTAQAFSHGPIVTIQAIINNAISIWSLGSAQALLEGLLSEEQMLIDLSLPIDAKKLPSEAAYKTFVDAGHAGTHFDVVNKSFPLESFRTRGKVIDISHIRDREVEVEDLGSISIEADDFVIFHTGFIDQF